MTLPPLGTDLEADRRRWRPTGSAPGSFRSRRLSMSPWGASSVCPSAVMLAPAGDTTRYSSVRARPVRLNTWTL